jgi:hypothetical protein
MQTIARVDEKRGHSAFSVGDFDIFREPGPKKQNVPFFHATRSYPEKQNMPFFGTVSPHL